MAMAALHHCVVDRTKKAQARVEKRERDMAKVAKLEGERLMEILEADREDREADRLEKGIFDNKNGGGGAAGRRKKNTNNVRLKSMLD